MNRRPILSIAAPIALLGLSAGAAGAQQGATLPTTADTAGAFADTARAPDPTASVTSATCDGDVEYCPSGAQLRVDRSFSDYPIDSRAADAGSGLRPIDDEPCIPDEGCERRDAAGVRHFLYGDGADDLRVMIKTVEASEFEGRPIGALDIGTARDQSEVMARVRRFLPDVAFDCDPSLVSGNVGPVECGATLNPGWVEIGFDHDGRLLRVRFDGYQFV